MPRVRKPQRRVSLLSKQIESSKKQTSSKAESKTDGKTGSLQASNISTAKQGMQDPVFLRTCALERVLRTQCMRLNSKTYCQKIPPLSPQSCQHANPKVLAKSLTSQTPSPHPRLADVRFLSPPATGFRNTRSPHPVKQGGSPREGRLP